MVCPLVAESEALDLAAAEERFAVLRERFGPAVGLAHGQQDAVVRDATLAAFARGRAGCWWRRRWWRSGSMCRPRR